MNNQKNGLQISFEQERKEVLRLIKDLKNNENIKTTEQKINEFNEIFPYNAIYRGGFTKNFITWITGGKVYLSGQNKERVTFYIPSKLNKNFNDFVLECENTSKKRSKYLEDIIDGFLEMVNMLKERNIPHDKKHLLKLLRKLVLKELNENIVSNSDIAKYINESINFVYGNIRELSVGIKSLKGEFTPSKIVNKMTDILKFLDKMETSISTLLIQDYHSDTPFVDFEVLLLDDNNDNIKRANVLFKKHGNTIHCVNHLIDFFVALKNHKPKVVLIDTYLSGMKKGYEICLLMKTHDNYKDIPIIVYTSATNPEHDDIIKNYKADHFFNNNFGYDNIYKIIKKYLK